MPTPDEVAELSRILLPARDSFAVGAQPANSGNNILDSTAGPALPPDVRRWLCPAVSLAASLGYAPGAGLARWIASRVIFLRPTDCCIDIRRHVHVTHRRAKPAPRAQPDERCMAPAGHSHRRTSGGKAVPGVESSMLLPNSKRVCSAVGAGLVGIRSCLFRGAE